MFSFKSCLKTELFMSAYTSRFQRHDSATDSLAISCALQMYFRLD